MWHMRKAIGLKRIEQVTYNWCMMRPSVPARFEVIVWMVLTSKLKLEAHEKELMDRAKDRMLKESMA